LLEGDVTKAQSNNSILSGDHFSASGDSITNPQLNAEPTKTVAEEDYEITGVASLFGEDNDHDEEDF
jgi:hypothetical protein